MTVRKSQITKEDSKKGKKGIKNQKTGRKQLTWQ